MFEVLNSKMQQLVESGISAILVEQGMETFKPETVDKIANPLSLKHFQNWFQILMILLYLSIFVLFIEVFVKNLKKKMNVIH